MSGTETPVHLTRLECAACGGPLRGVASDVVFFCWTCRSAVDVTSATGCEMPLVFGRAKPAQVYLPFWRLQGSVNLLSAPPEKSAAASSWCCEQTAYVPAFLVHNAQYFADAGVALTMTQPEPDEVREGRVAGAARGLSDALRHARFVLLSCLDRVVDVTGVEIGFSLDTASILALAFTFEANHLTGPESSVRYPFNAIEGAADVAALCGWPLPDR